MLTCTNHIVTYKLLLHDNECNLQRVWISLSQQVSGVVTTQWLQCDHTLSVKSVACELVSADALFFLPLSPSHL